jgi:hypothetical protein
MRAKLHFHIRTSCRAGGKNVSRQRKNLKGKIASLTALGAGALIAGTGRADASTIYSGPINVDVGVSGLSKFTTNLHGSNTAGFSNTMLTFARLSNTPLATKLNIRSIRAVGRQTSAVQFASTGSRLRLFQSGATFSNGVTAKNNVLIGGRYWGTTVNGVPKGSVFGLGSFGPEFALFKFKAPSGQTEYGWVLLSLSVTQGPGPNPALGPDLTIYGYAWDNTGALLPAGAGSGVPEPGTMGLTGLGALALGAAGLRRWRKSRPRA